MNEVLVRRLNKWSFYLLLFCIGLSSYSLYSNLNNGWLLSPPTYIILVLSALCFFLGIIGFGDSRNWRTKLRSWLTVILALLLSIILILAVFLSTLGFREYMKTTKSPDNNYTIDFYRFDEGAMGTFGVIGELKGPLWFKKRIYYEKRIENIDVEWETNSKLSINNHILNLDEGSTYGY